MRLLAPVAAAVTLVLGVTSVTASAATVATPSPSRAATPGPNAVIGGDRLGVSGAVVVDAPGAPAPPAPPSESWLLADLDTGAVLATRNAHEQLPPASTLKTLTALTLLPKLDPHQLYTATHDDANAEGSKVGVVPGATYTVDQLWLGLFLPSGNDAAHALAAVGGGLDTTIAAMAAQARHLQAKDTVPKSPSGLDTPGQVSSAYDLALIARAGLQLPSFAHYASTLRAQFPGKPSATPGAPRPTYEIQNQNKLLWNYDGALGVKTGYTTIARNTFVGAATRNGHRLVVTIMKDKAGTWKHAAALLDWGFANLDRAHPVGTLVSPAVPVVAAAPAAAAVAHAPAAHIAAAPTSAGVSLPLRVLLALLIVAVTSAVVLRVRTVRRRRARRARAAATRRVSLARQATTTQPRSAVPRARRPRSSDRDPVTARRSSR